VWSRANGASQERSGDEGERASRRLLEPLYFRAEEKLIKQRSKRVSEETRGARDIKDFVPEFFFSPDIAPRRVGLRLEIESEHVKPS